MQHISILLPRSNEGNFSETFVAVLNEEAEQYVNGFSLPSGKTMILLSMASVGTRGNGGAIGKIGGRLALRVANGIDPVVFMPVDSTPIVFTPVAGEDNAFKVASPDEATQVDNRV